MPSKRWTPEEEQAVCTLYVSMIHIAESGERLNKAAMIRTAREGRLKDRSRGSIEYKLMNCTTWALKLGLPVVVGYAPYGTAAGSIGALLSQAFKAQGQPMEWTSKWTAPLKSLDNLTEYAEHLPSKS